MHQRSKLTLCAMLALFLFHSSLHAQVGQVKQGFEGQLTVNGKGGQKYNLRERMGHYGVPGLSIALIRNGKIAWAQGYGVLQAGGNEPVNAETVFSVGSVSKVGTAAAALRLVEQGKLSLDQDVNRYLTSWEVPTNRYTLEKPVTLRAIMSHTAGLTVHGFADFQPGEKLPNTVQILEGSGPAKNPPVVVNIPVGSRFRYSGGGTTVTQLMIEEATGMDFPAATRALVFEPLNMLRSTYQNPVPASHGNIAKAHNRNGRARALPRGYEAMPEAGASGLWTTPSDVAQLIIAILNAYSGDSEDFISQSLAQDMLTPVEPSLYGLGPSIQGSGNQMWFQHGGSNDSYKAFMMGIPGADNGLVIFTNGSRGSELIREVRQAIIDTEGWDL